MRESPVDSDKLSGADWLKEVKLSEADYILP